MNNYYKNKVYRSGNTIHVDSLTHPQNVSDFLRVTHHAFTKSGFYDLNLDLSKVNRVFPNACVPICGLISYYREQDYDISLRRLPQLLKNSNFDNPKEPEPSELQFGVFNKVWKFKTSEQVGFLMDKFHDQIAEKVECEKGVVEAFVWCLNEIMDNVLQHSTVSEGFIMIQVHPEAHKVAVCLFDKGIGIFNSLLKSNDLSSSPKNSVDAITLAMKEGVTRDKKAHQGNGLFGLEKIVSLNSGSLTITSGKGSVYHNTNGEVQIYDRLPFLSWNNQCTSIDFQLNTLKPISLSKALSGHEPINIRLEAFENDSGRIIVSVRDKSHGFGTRIAAKEFRNLIVNLINEKNSKITIDFDGIPIVSSSFADELVGKLVVKYGFYNFQKVIELTEVNDTIQILIHKAVAQRMSESLRSNELNNDD